MNDMDFVPYEIEVCHKAKYERVIIKLPHGGGNLLYKYLLPLVYKWASSKRCRRISAERSEDTLSLIQEEWDEFNRKEETPPK